MQLFKDDTTVPPDTIYLAYPRREAKKKSLEKIASAIGYIADNKRMTKNEASQWLLSRVQKYAKSPKVQNKKRDGEQRFIPMMTTWLSRGSYDDDDAAWGYKPATPPTPPRIAKDIASQRAANEGRAHLHAFRSMRNDEQRESVRRQADRWWKRAADHGDDEQRKWAEEMGVA